MVKFNDLSLKLKNNKILTVFDRVIKSGWLILGSEVKNFETAFANYLKIDHCITVANGTDAIEIGLKSGGVKPNDKVATVANAGAYTTTSILAIGASPIFMDIDEKTMLTSFEQVKKAYSKGARAVVITHLFGSICPDIVKISKFCEKNNVLLFEDCAQCHGLELDGKKAGTFGNIASFSFYPTKNLGALGDGGAIVTNNHKYADLARSLRQYGWSKKYYISNQGGRNSRLDELQAAVLLLFLPDLDKSNKKRRHVAYRYNNEIKNSNIVLPNFDTLNSVFHLYVVKSKKRDLLQKYLTQNNIGNEIHYPIPDHKQTELKSFFNNVNLPITEKLSSEVLSLPCNEFLDDNKITEVILILNKWSP